MEGYTTTADSAHHEFAPQRSMVDRMKGAALLDVPTYEEVEADTGATPQAAGVVAIVAVASAIGGAGLGLGGIIVGILSALLGWAIWAGVTYLIGDKLLDGTATWGELLRTLGFAMAPGVLLVLAFIPVLGWILNIGVRIWILIAGVIAIRQALDFGTGKALLTGFLGWLAVLLPMLLLGAIS